MSESNSTTQEQFALTAPPENRKEEQKAKRRAYARDYYQANKEALNAKARVYREANKETIAAREKAWYEANKEVERMKRKAYHEANKETINSRHRGHSLKYKYGLTSAQRDAMIEAQGNRCLCCKTPFGILKDSRPRIDHCHVTGRVRGILCNACNTALGHSKDDVKLLRALIRYLQRMHSCP